ncbi:hypothetical protein [Bacteroides caecimuris]|uniref:hypothetical protein n=1 Tax=Bacteroides caecimuris TaxID=1796613 RepID=UPI0025B77097|nr:hypothetical protein [Bacteroides caecimuris]
MTKISQCNQCQIGKGVHCEYYFPFDDSDCTHFKLGENKAQEKRLSLSKYGYYLLLIACYLIVRSIGGWHFNFVYEVLFICGLGLFYCFAKVLLIGGIKLFYYLVKRIFKSYPYMEIRKVTISTLKNLGCQPEIDKETGNMSFKYQGEEFFVVVEAETIITFYDTWWGTLDLDDPLLDNLKEAINKTNMNAMPVTLYSISENENKLGVHSRYQLIFTKDTPNKEELFNAILNSFFEVHQEVKGRFSALNDIQDKKEEKERIRIKGFSNSER